MAKVLNQASLWNMLEYYIGDEGHICREEIGRKSELLVRWNKKVNFTGINLGANCQLLPIVVVSLSGSLPKPASELLSDTVSS